MTEQEMLDRIAALEHRVAALERPAVRGPERARPMIDPDDGAPPGSGTVTTSGQCTEWSAEPFAGSADNCEVQPVDSSRVEVVLGAGLAML